MKLVGMFLLIAIGLGAAACGGVEGEELESSEDAVFGACTAQIMRNETNAYGAYVACTRNTPGKCGAQENAWKAANDIADNAGCYDGTTP